MGTLKEDWKVASRKSGVELIIVLVSMLICGGVGIYAALLFLFSASAGNANWLYCLGAGVMCGSLYILGHLRISDKNTRPPVRGREE